MTVASRSAPRPARLGLIVFAIGAILSGLVAGLQYHAVVAQWLAGAIPVSDFGAIRDGAAETVAGRGYAAYGHGPVYYTYPPTLAVLFYPLTQIPQLPAHLIWVAASAGLYALAMLTVWQRVQRETGRPIAGGDLACVAVAIAASYPLATNIISGQGGLACAALLTLGLVHAKDRPWIAGLCLAILTYKPHYGLLVPVALLGGRCWRTIGTTACLALALVAISLLAFGISPWQGFLDGMRGTGARMDAGGFTNMRMVTVFTAVYDLLGRSVPARSIALTAQIGVGLIAGWLTFTTWRTRPASLAAVAVSLAALPLSTPYLFDYDLMVYGPALLIWAALAADRNRSAMQGLLGLYLIAGPWGLISAILTNDRFNLATILHPLAFACLGLSALIWRGVTTSPETPERTPNQEASSPAVRSA